MRIALLGTRGIPANYGGFETFAEEISIRLAERGHRVTVYCRSKCSSSEYRGVQLRYLPTLQHKYLDTVVHTALSTLDAVFRGFDALLYCNAANAVFTFVPRLVGIPTALNVDGIERHRKKWNRFARSWYLVSEWLATWCPSSTISDAETIRDYYLQRFHKSSTFIPYGAETGKIQSCDQVRALGLEPGRYVLYVSRMEPENNALLVRQAFEMVNTDFKLALIGDAPYAADYVANVKDTRDARVVVPGAIYGAGYHQLQSHCGVYVQATEVGGTHPAMIEAMGRAAPVLYLKTPENVEVAGETAVGFDTSPEDLARKLQWMLDLSAEERAEWGRRAMERVRSRYSWEVVTAQYEALLRALAKRP
jgi:glycosyltransferase involved in cell wall biosynthesis